MLNATDCNPADSEPENETQNSKRAKPTSDDEEPFEKLDLAMLASVLSPETLQALAEFQKEQQKVEELPTDNVHSMDLFKEDWAKSQFWYTKETCTRLVDIILGSVSETAIIGCISAPSVYTALAQRGRQSYVFEIDKRFKVFGTDFVYYDYNLPEVLDELDGERKLVNQFDVLYIDPPFLSEECFQKMAGTAKLLMKDDCKLIIVTGHVMREHVLSELGCTPTNVEIEHHGLSNDFYCYTNFETK